MRAVSNAGPLIHLARINHLHLLPALFDEVLIPVAVWQEVSPDDIDVPDLAALRQAVDAGWLRVHAVSATSGAARLQADLDPGESEAIMLAREVTADALLMDERRGRTHAQREGLPVLGTIGLLRLGRDRGLIPAAAPLLLDQLLPPRAFPSTPLER